MKKRNIFVLLALICTSLPAFVFAETIVTRSGQTVTGKLIEKTGKYIKIDFQGVPLVYYFDEIKSIDGKPMAAAATENNSSAVDKDASASANQAESYIRQGRDYFARGDYNRAIENFKKIIPLFPDNPVAYSSVGVSYASLGQHQEAIKYFNKVLELNPQDADTCTTIAGSYVTLGQYDQATKYLKRALVINPDSAWAYNGLALVYTRFGQDKEAKESLKKAQELFEKQGNKEKAQQMADFIEKYSEIKQQLISQEGK